MSDSSALPKSCPKCGAVLPSEVTEGLCPKCLMNEAMEPTLISDASKPRGTAILAPEELAPHFPAYEILRMLGRGGMGAVYLARQISLNRLVAIKLLPADMNEGEINFADRFKNEAQAMAQLNHPGIVAVHDFGQTANGLLFIVMEYIEGTDVQLMLTSQGRLHSAHAMAITAHVCDALQYAHARGIIHRDIKPSNIMVSNDGVVKVADFGLAKMSHSQTTGLTQSGMAMGTPHFMAPEALMLGSAVDQRADIYAVGVMLYQMLTGKLPQGMFEMPSFQVTGLDPRYDRIVARALRDDRELRYQAANELRYDLDAILTQPVEKIASEASEDVAALPPVDQREKKRAPQPLPRVKTEASAAEDTRAKQHRSSVYGWMAALMTLAAVGLAVWFVFFSKPSQFADAPDTEGWHDLMRLIEPKRDAVNGLWAMKDGALVCKSAPWALCEVPLNYSGGNYDYRISLTRGEGNQLAVFFPFRKGDAAGDVVFDYSQSTFTTGKRSGLENVAGASLSSEEDQVRKAGGVVRFRKDWIPRGVRSTVLIQVRDEGICVSLNGEEVWRWKGDWTWVTQTHGAENQLFWNLNGRKVFGVGIYGCEATFHSIQMREVSEREGKMLPPEVSKATQPNVSASASSVPSAFAMKGEIMDLMASLTPEIVEKTGNGWRMENGALHNPGRPFAALPLPVNFVGISYELRVKLRQLKENEVFNIDLPVGSGMVGFALDGFPKSGHYTGLQGVNGKMGSVLPGTTHGNQVSDFEPHDLVVTVRPAGTQASIVATLDGRPLYEWKGLIAELTPALQWKSPQGTMTLGTIGDDWMIYEVKAKRLDGLPPHSSSPAGSGTSH